MVLQLSRLGLNALVFLILARWLSLAEIGLFAIAFTPVQILQNTLRGGFSETIVQQHDPDGQFDQTVFWMSTAAGVLGLGVLLLGAAAMEPLFGMAEAGTYMAAMAPVPLLIGLGAVPEGLLRRRLQIRTLALRTTASLSVAAVIALALGYAEYGTWALVGFTLINALCATVIVLLLSGFRPRAVFDRRVALRALDPIRFISARLLVGIAALPVVQFLVGLILGPAAAGAFQIAQRVMKLSEAVALEPIRFAILPMFARVARDEARLARGLVKACGLVTFLMVPAFFGLIAIAPDLMPLLVGAQNGPPSVPVLQALLAIGGAGGIYSMIMQALTASGRARQALHWSVISMVLRIGLAGLGLLISVEAAAAGYALSSILIVPLLLHQAAAYFGLDPRAAWGAILRPTAIGIVMVAATLAAGWMDLPVHAAILVALQILVGAAIYLSLSALINRTQLATLTDLLSAAFARRR